MDLGINQLTLQLILGYIMYPIAFFMGVPRAEILRVSQLLATKLVANEFAAYLGERFSHVVPPFLRADVLEDLQADNEKARIHSRLERSPSHPMRSAGLRILVPLGIQIGVLSALAPSRSKVIARIAVSAMFCGFISTLQTAGIA